MPEKNRFPAVIVPCEDVTHTLRAEGFDASEDGTGWGVPLVPVVLRGHSDYGEGLPNLRADGGDCGGGSEALIAFPANLSGTQYASQEDVSPSLGALNPTAVAFAENSRAELRLCGGDGQVCSQLTTGGGKPGQGQPCIAFSAKDHGQDAGECAPTLRSMGHDASHPNGGRDGMGVGAIQSGYQVRRLTPVECARLQSFPDSHCAVMVRKGKREVVAADGNQYKQLGNSMNVLAVGWPLRRLVEAMMKGKSQ